MACLGITFRPSADESCCCLCSKPTASHGGPVLVLGQNSVCRECGKERAPSLAALLALAQVAERVGRIKRHMLVPPLEALLELAGAAEDYASCTSPPLRDASRSERPKGMVSLNCSNVLQHV
jgi:hypothetical protein